MFVVFVSRLKHAEPGEIDFACETVSCLQYGRARSSAILATSDYSLFRSLYYPNALHGKFGLLSSGKASRHTTMLPRFIFLCAVFSCFRFKAFQEMPDSNFQSMLGK